MRITGNIKKENGSVKFHSLLRVVFHKCLRLPESYPLSPKIKNAKRLPLHDKAMVSSDTYTILNNVCPGLPIKPAACWSSKSSQDISGISCQTPVPLAQVSIKINYVFILAQHLVSCQLLCTIYTLFQFFKNFFKYFFHTGYLIVK